MSDETVALRWSSNMGARVAFSKASKLRVQGLSKKSMLLWAFVPAVAMFAGGSIFGLGVELSLAIAGTLFGIATFVLSLFQREGPRDRKIAFVPMSNSGFSRAIFSGLSTMLDKQGSLSIDVQWPPDGVDTLEWQLEALRSGFAATADAVVIVPALDSESMWNELTRLAAQGVFLVVLDTKPPNAVFVAAEVPSPSFVGSDFCKGGSIVGSYIADYLRQSPENQALVAVGPLNAWPAMERSRSLVLELCRAGVAGQTRFLDLAAWNEVGNAGTLVREVLSMGDGATVSDLIVFCPNDKIAERVDYELPVDHTGVTLVGYDGSIDEGGELALHRCRRMSATVDTKPREQGATAARLLIQEHLGTLRGRTTVYVGPALVAKS